MQKLKQDYHLENQKLNRLEATRSIVNIETKSFGGPLWLKKIDFSPINQNLLHERG